ncbi:MAG: hypothetical protein HPY44_18630 [Armatimonadetes bacterium]|nr:hypothetical protein [Armatimonadota bacterium]
MRGLCIFCVFALTLCGTVLAQNEGAAQAPDDTLTEPPAGVTVELIQAPAPPAEKPVDEPAGAEKPQTALQEAVKAPLIKLQYSGVPFRDVLADISEKLGLIIICRDQKLLERSYYRTLNVPDTMAMDAICRPVLQEPRRAFIMCGIDEVWDSELLPKVSSDKWVKITLEDAVLGDALDYISEVTGTTVDCTDQWRKEKVTCEVEGKPLEDALKEVAKAAKLELTTGYKLQRMDIEKGIEQLEQMSDEDLEKMFRRGLGMMKEAEGTVPNLQQEVQGRVAQGMMDGVRMFNDMDPEDQRELVRQGASAIRRLAALTQRLTPETQAELKSRVKPFMGLVLAGYMAMPAPTRAQLGPIMQALNSFGW